MQRLIGQEWENFSSMSKEKDKEGAVLSNRGRALFVGFKYLWGPGGGKACTISVRGVFYAVVVVFFTIIFPRHDSTCQNFQVHGRYQPTIQCQ